MNRRPAITVTFAQSLDGRIATKDGSSQWISGPETLELAHELRNANSAIMVGIGTVLADNPRLTCRLPSGSSPVRIVLDTRLRIPLDCHIVETAGDPPSIVFTAPKASAKAEEALTDQSVRVERVPVDESGRLDLRAVCERLTTLGLASVLIEGGSGLITSTLRSGIWDRIVAVTAPIFIGQGVETVGDLGPVDLPSLPRHRTVSVERRGNDVVWIMERADG